MWRESIVSAAPALAPAPFPAVAPANLPPVLAQPARHNSVAAIATMAATEVAAIWLPPSRLKARLKSTPRTTTSRAASLDDHRHDDRGKGRCTPARGHP